MQAETTQLGALDAIHQRRAIRAFTADAVDASTIRQLLDAAVHAPTAMHLEPWAFVIVQDQAGSNAFPIAPKR